MCQKHNKRLKQRDLPSLIKEIISLIFKYINNFYGFEFGDRILRKINESISQQLNVHELIARI